MRSCVSEMPWVGVVFAAPKSRLRIGRLVVRLTPRLGGGEGDGGPGAGGVLPQPDTADSLHPAARPPDEACENKMVLDGVQTPLLVPWLIDRLLVLRCPQKSDSAA